MASIITNIHPLATSTASLLLRLTFGGMFTYYGFLKIESYDQMLAMIGDPIGLGSKLSLHLVIFAEFVCGVLVVLGLLTRLALLPIAITMIVVFFVVHGHDPFLAKQLPFVYMLLCMPLFIMGSGKWSIDYMIFKSGINGRKAEIAKGV